MSELTPADCARMALEHDSSDVFLIPLVRRPQVRRGRSTPSRVVSPPEFELAMVGDAHLDPTSANPRVAVQRSSWIV